jgi:hypothetical protein
MERLSSPVACLATQKSARLSTGDPSCNWRTSVNGKEIKDQTSMLSIPQIREIFGKIDFTTEYLTVTKSNE